MAGSVYIDDHTRSRKIAYQKLVLAVTLLTSFYVTIFLAAVQVFPDIFPHKIRLVHETRDAPHRRSMGL